MPHHLFRITYLQEFLRWSPLLATDSTLVPCSKPGPRPALSGKASTVGSHAHYLALLRFRSELVAWIEGRIRDRDDRTRSLEVLTSLDGDASCGQLVRLTVGIAVPGDSNARIQLTLDLD